MSLVMAIRCGDSAVVLADSQETYGAFKASVDKIVPIAATFVDVGFAAAGNAAGLIDSFSDYLRRRIGASTAAGADEIRRELSDALASFHASAEFSQFPGDSTDKIIVGTICVRIKASGEVLLFRSHATALVPVDSYHLMGYDHELYDVTAKRLYRPKLMPQQAVIVGLNVFSLAKKTCTAISGPVRVLIATPEAITLENDSRVAELEGFVDRTLAAVDELILFAPLPNIPTGAFRFFILDFQRNLFKMRDEALQVSMRRASSELAAAKSREQIQKIQSQLLPPSRLFSLGPPPHGLSGFETVEYPVLFQYLAYDRYVAVMMMIEMTNVMFTSREISPEWHQWLLTRLNELLKLGLKLWRESDAVTKSYESGKQDHKEFLDLWLAGGELVDKTIEETKPLNCKPLNMMLNEARSIYETLMPDGFTNKLIDTPIPGRYLPGEEPPKKPVRLPRFTWPWRRKKEADPPAET